MLKTKRLLARIASLEAENKELKSRLQCKTDSLMYVNSILSKRNQELIQARSEVEALRAVLRTHVSYLDFPNSSVEEGQISIQDILEH